MAGFNSRNPVESCLHGEKGTVGVGGGGVDGIKEKKTSELPNADVVSVYNPVKTHHFIAKYQHKCKRNVLWCQLHSPHNHADHKTSFNYDRKHQPSG